MNATLQHIGNEDLLHRRKTAFLCSRNVPAAAVLKCYDWAVEQRERGACVISGFHSQIEKDVLHYLLKGAQPVVVVLARGMKQKLDAIFEKPLSEGRLLILSPFPEKTRRVTTATAVFRNRFMTEIADDIVVGFASKDSNLPALLQKTSKPARHLHSS